MLVEGSGLGTLRLQNIFGCSQRLLLLAILTCAVPLAAARTLNVPNAEDLALVDGGRWVVASSMPGGALSQGGLYAVNVATGDAHRITPLRDSGLRRDPACREPVAAGQLAPHGISTSVAKDGSELLWVVNHGVRESIEIYRISGGKTLGLSWQGCLLLPAGAMGNAVAVDAQGQVFVTNYGASISGTPKTDRWMGDVLVWQRGRGWQAVAGSDIFAPNGLLVSTDGQQLYVNSWAAGQVLHLDRATGERQTLTLPFLPDNLRWGAAGEIVAAGLYATATEVARCVMASGPCERHIATGAALIGVTDFTVKCQRKTPLHMGTVALRVADELWLGPVRGDAILALDGRSPAWDQCR
ncbi:hypothetical protein [Pseudomaricurvus sp. HS19]|uniref:hypothetical protein n=1 Tax=Pseudomaricurvus sp. HS19 TaxID=2692626 RepID=UPI00136C475A|nr:hypothetical protein [Pseudomaricurvus sp. HS19]MYM61840.1 hypothetical protein [Pseudomaricurvus sp. HS19]